MGGKESDQSRIVSLDQFRGYTVLGMIFGNFSFKAINPFFQHHNTYCSYADTIMPHFFLAVGFAYRLTLLKRLQTVGPRTAYFHAVRRNLGLILLGCVIYHFSGGIGSWSELEKLGVWGFLKTGFQREPFETLVHIGVTSLWIMPVIAAGAWTRICFAIASGVLHWFLSAYGYYDHGSWHGYYDFVMHRPGIDGGPLGFLTWTIPMIAGSLAYDAMAHGSRGGAATRIFLGGVLLMALGYAMSCLNRGWPPNEPPTEGISGWLVEPPFKPPLDEKTVNIWTMSQRAGSVSYLTFGAGISLAVYALFVVLCDIGSLRVGIFQTFGSNALAAYILHPLVARMIRPYAPDDSPLWYALCALGLQISINYLFIRHLEKHKLFLKL